MSLPIVVDVVIGMVVVYLLLSVVCSGINELFAGLLNRRGRHLADGIRRLLGDEELKERFYSHALVQSLANKRGKPSYVPASMFPVVVLDLLAPSAPDWTRTAAQIGERIDRLPAESSLRRILTLFMDRAQGDLEKLHRSMEEWFEQAMQRVTGVYRRNTQYSLFAISLVVSFGLNVDSLRLAHDLAVNPPLRDALVAYAQQTVQHPLADTPRADTTTTAGSAAPADTAALHRVMHGLDTMQELGIPLGWGRPAFPRGFLNWLLGVFITTFAVALGSPFWFDALGKLVNLRASGPAGTPAATPPKGK